MSDKINDLKNHVDTLTKGYEEEMNQGIRDGENREALIDFFKNFDPKDYLGQK